MSLYDLYMVDDPFKSNAVKTPFETDRISRKGVMITGKWSDEIANFICQNNDIKALYLNSSRGWIGSDYSFLSELKTIEELHILSGIKAVNLAALEDMSSLIDLEMTVVSNEKIQFDRLTHLKHCFLSYWRGVDSILQCKRLKSLYLDNYKPKGIVDFSVLNSLNSLTIGNSTIENIDFVKDLSALNILEFYNCKKVSDFSALSQLPNLKKLVIDGNKELHNIEFVSHLSKLQFLSVTDCPNLASIKAVGNNKQLKAFAFAGNTVVADGDLSPLELLPELSMLMFQARKHYTHRLIKPWDWHNFASPDTLLAKK